MISFKQKHIVVIDPGLRIPETDVFNTLSTFSKVPFTYHLPGIADVESLNREDPAGIQAIIVLGGGASLTEKIEWRHKLESWFKSCLDEKVPTLAVAWGHQWIAHLFGGKVGLIPHIEEKVKGFRQFTLKESGPFKNSQGRLAFSHRAMVLEAPQASKCFIESTYIENEGFVYDNYPIYSFQAHPEATEIYLKNGNYPKTYSSEDLKFGHSLIKDFLNWSETYK